MIDLDAGSIEIVRRILAEHVPDIEARVFGSRAGGKARKFSDLDLVLIGHEKLNWERLDALKDAFSDSNLPIRVDVLDWHAIPPSFQKVTQKQYAVIQEGKRSVTA